MSAMTDRTSAAVAAPVAARAHCVVVSQPMYFPWVGMLEQIRLADTFVFYDDVQFARRSFTKRVQLKTAQGVRWMSVPLRAPGFDDRIDEVEVDDSEGWREQHRAQLAQSCRGAPHLQDALALLDGVLGLPTTSLCELARASMVALADYFGLAAGTAFRDSSRLGVPGAKTVRLLDICRHVGAARYVTGHGASRYLEHARFDEAGIAVEYMDYQLRPYAQGHGAFTPYVSALDLVANCGREGARHIVSGTIGWREMLARQAAAAPAPAPARAEED